MTSLCYLMEKYWIIDFARTAVIILDVLHDTSSGTTEKTVLDVVVLIVMKDLVVIVLSGGLKSDREKTKKIL